MAVNVKRKIVEAMIPIAKELGMEVIVLAGNDIIKVASGGKASKDWNMVQEALALKQYLKPQGKQYANKLARAIGRSKGSLSFKMSNLRKYDRTARSRGAKGAGNGSKADKAIWALYRNHPKQFAALVTQGERQYDL